MAKKRPKPKPVRKGLAKIRLWEDAILRSNIEDEATAILETFYERLNGCIFAVATNMKEGARK